MENQNDIKGLLQEKFQHHEATPPRDIWAQIEADINPPQKRKVVWWPYMAVAASALILFGLWTLLGTGSQTSLLPAGNGMAETTPAENALPNPQESLRPADETPTLSAQEEPEEDVRPANIQPLYQRASSKNLAQQAPEIAPAPESAQQVEPEETVNSYAIALNPISPINPQLYPDAPANQLEERAPEVVKPTKLTKTIADNTRQLKKVKDNKLDLNEFSLENVVAFASNELSKIAGSPLDYEHQQGENTERKRYEIELGDFKFTRTSFRKTTNQ